MNLVGTYLKSFRSKMFTRKITFYTEYAHNQFWSNLIQKFKIITLSWNLIVSLIQICQIQTFFCFSLKTPILGKFAPKIKIVSLDWKLVPRLIRVCRIQWWCSALSIFNRKYPVWTHLVQKIKIVSLRWNLVPRLIQICRIQW